MRGFALVCTFVVLAAVPAAAGAQDDYAAVATVAPAWTARFEQPVRWQRVMPMGQLVVATDCCLYGVDPAGGAVVWSHGDLPALSESSFETVPATPLFVVSTSGLDAKSLVVDSTDGTVVFDSRAAGIANILSRVVLFESEGLLILGQETGDPTIKLFLAETASGKIRWTNDEVLGPMSDGMKKVVGLLARVAQAGLDEEEKNAAFATRPLEVGADAVLLASGGTLHKLSLATGEPLWQVSNRDGDGEATLFRVEDRPGLVLVGTEIVGRGMSTNGETPVQTRYAAYRLKDGSPAWSESVKQKGPVHPPVLLAEGAILSPGGSQKGKLKYVEYDSGRSVWGKNGKGIPSDGGIVDYRRTPHGLVVTTGHDSAWNDMGTVYSLNLLDTSAGAWVFPKPLEVRGRMLSTEIVPSGVLYRTTHEVDVFDPETGRSRLGRAVSSESLVTAEHGDALYAFARDEGALYRIDKKTATLARLGEEKVELEGKDAPRSLEVDADGITLIGTQNVVGFDPRGAVVFRQFYPPPRHPGWVRALMIAQSVRAGMASVQAGVAGAALAEYASTQEDGTIGRELGDELARGYTELSRGAAGISADYARMARERFQASVEARDFQFMMVQLPRGYAIAQVAKDDGKIRGLIPIGKDKTPSYQVDDVADRIYYRVDPHRIQGYAF